MSTILKAECLRRPDGKHVEKGVVTLTTPMLLDLTSCRGRRCRGCSGKGEIVTIHREQESDRFEIPTLRIIPITY